MASRAPIVAGADGDHNLGGLSVAFQMASAGFEDSLPPLLNGLVQLLRRLLSGAKIGQVRSAIAATNLIQMKLQVRDGIPGEHPQQELTPLVAVRT